MRKLKNVDLRSMAVQREVTKFVRDFTPRSWWQHLTPSMAQLWAGILQRSAFGNVGQDLFIALGIHGEPFGGVGTWMADAEGVYYAWSGGGRCIVWQIPEWHFGLWRNVTNAFLHNTCPFPDWSDEFQCEDMDDLAEALEGYAKGHRVFRALGILGSIWAPEGDL